MESKMLDLKLQDTMSEIRKRTKIIDIIEYTLKQKWKWASHNYSKDEGQQVDQTLYRVATKEREEIKGMTKQKMARWHNREGGDHLDYEGNRQTTMEDIDGGLHPAVDGQSLDKDEELHIKLKSMSIYRHGKTKWCSRIHTNWTAHQVGKHKYQQAWQDKMVFKDSYELTCTSSWQAWVSTGISQAWYIVEIHHSGWEPSKWCWRIHTNWIAHQVGKPEQCSTSKAKTHLGVRW